MCFRSAKFFGRRPHLEGGLVDLHAEAVERRVEQGPPPAGVDSVAGLFQILDDVAVVRQHEPPVGAPGVDLEAVVVAIQVRCGDFDPLIDLAQGRLVTQPGPVLIQQRLHSLHHAHPGWVRPESAIVSLVAKDACNVRIQQLPPLACAFEIARQHDQCTILVSLNRPLVVRLLQKRDDRLPSPVDLGR